MNAAVRQDVADRPKGPGKRTANILPRPGRAGRNGEPDDVLLEELPGGGRGIGCHENRQADRPGESLRLPKRDTKRPGPSANRARPPQADRPEADGLGAAPLGQDRWGLRGEFVDLVESARQVTSPVPAPVAIAVD